MSVREAGRLTTALVAGRFKPDEPGCAVGVYRGGRVAYARGFGLADVRAKRPNGPRTVFNIGSTSKQFTALAVLMLAREGKLSLADPIRRHLPELPRVYAPVRVKHLMGHTSGMHSIDWQLAFAGQPALGDSRDAVMAMTRRASRLNFTPGSRFRYCNTGYFLMALIVERVSGVPFQEFARREIFAPLGMQQSWVRPRRSFRVPRLAHGYTLEGRGRVTRWPFGGPGGRGVTGAGEVLTTVLDLARWVRNFQTARAGGRRVLRDLHRPVWRGSKSEPGAIGGAPYAGGLALWKDRGLPLVSHAGGLAGFQAELLRVPSRELGVAVLMNRNAMGPADDPTALALEIANLWMGRAGAREGFPPGTKVVAPCSAARAIRVPSAVLSGHEGIYAERKPQGDRWAVVREAGGLRARAVWGRFRLTPFREDAFTGDGVGAQSEFYVRRGPGASREIVEFKSGKPFKRLGRTVRPGQAPRSALTGRYACDELGVTYRIVPWRWGLCLATPIDPWLVNTWFGGKRIVLWPEGRRGPRWFTEGMRVIFRRTGVRRVTGFSLLMPNGRVERLDFRKVG